jgi:hypothetical protein
MSVPSPAPGVEQTGDKATTAAAVSGVIVAVLLALALFYDEKNGTNFTEILLAVLGGLGTAGVTGVATYRTRNKPKRA